jgi:hypothetical protein
MAAVGKIRLLNGRNQVKLGKIQGGSKGVRNGFERVCNEVARADKAA